MRTASVLAAATVVACFACTYTIPNLETAAPDGGVEPSEASIDESGGPETSTASDTGGGSTTDTTVPAEAGPCTVNCPCANDSDCTTAKGAEGICAQAADVGADLGHAASAPSRAARPPTAIRARCASPRARAETTA